MAMEDQIGAIAELLKGMQSQMDEQHDSLMKAMEANTSALQHLCGKPPATPAATALILAASSAKCETEVANSTTSSAAPSVAQDVSLVVTVADSDYSKREVDITTGAGSSSPCSASSRSARAAASEYSLLTISNSGTEAEPAALANSPVPGCTPTVPIVNRDDCVREVVITTSDGKSSTTFATSSASSPPVATPLDVDSAVLVVSSDYTEVTHSSCSTPGLHQVATILVPVMAFSAPSTSTPTSTALLDSRFSVVAPTKHSMLVRSFDVSVPASVDILAVAPTFLATTPMFKAIKTSASSSVGMAQLCVDTNTSSIHELFEVLLPCPCVPVPSVDDRQYTEHILPKPPWSLVWSKIRLSYVSLSVAVRIGPELQQKPRPPSSKDNGKEMKCELLPLFLLIFGFSQGALVLMSPRPLSQSKLMQLQLYASCVHGCAVSKYLVILPHCVISLEHWFELLVGELQLDVCNRRQSVSWSDSGHNFWASDVYMLIMWLSSVQYGDNIVILQHLEIPWPPHILFQTFGIGSHKEENWKQNLLAENLSCALLREASVSLATTSEGISFLVCLLSVLSLSDYSQKSIFTLPIAWTSTTAIHVFHCISISPFLAIGMHQLGINTNAGNTHELFEVNWKPPWVSLVCMKITSYLVSSSNFGILTVECLDSKTKLVLEMEKNRKLLQYKVVALFSNLQPLPCLFIFCSEDKARQSKFLLVLMSGICYLELPIMHSKFQSYVWVPEVLSGRPEALYIICRHGGKFLLQPWPPPMFVEILDSQVEDSIMKIRPTPWLPFSYQIEVQSKGQWASVCFVSLDVGLHCSKEKMAWYCCLQFLLETSSACASSPATHTKVDVEKIEWGSCFAYLIFNALTSWFPIEVVWAGESFAVQLDAACQNICPWRGNDCADGFHITQSVLQDQQRCWYVVQLPVDRKLTWEMLKIQAKCEKFWGTDELPILVGDMSYSASEIARLHPHEAVNVNYNCSSTFSLSKLALFLLFVNREEISDLSYRLHSASSTSKCYGILVDSFTSFKPHRISFSKLLCSSYKGLLERLGGKPCFKEGRMSGYCRLGRTEDEWAGLILYRPMAACHEMATSLRTKAEGDEREEGVEDQNLETGGELTLEASITLEASLARVTLFL